MQNTEVKTLSILDAIFQDKIDEQTQLNSVNAKPIVVPHNQKSANLMRQKFVDAPSNHVLSDSSPVSSQLIGASRGSIVKKKKLPRHEISTRSKVYTPENRTPEWIREIFYHAEYGNLEKLKSHLKDLEGTIIRNLSDHSGNNVLHALCKHGHVHVLPWLSQHLGSETNEALLADENRHGFTPMTLGIKHGQITIIKWFLRTGGLKRRILCNEDDRKKRCLLHFAVKFANDKLVSFICDEMMKENLTIDQRDCNGNTPLHLAARKGNLTICSLLLRYGAQVQSTNEMGFRPYDYATKGSHKECYEYLLLYGAASNTALNSMASKKQVGELEAENSALKNSLKQVLNIAKTLSIERDHLCRDLGHLYDSIIQLHDSMTMEIQILSAGNGNERPMKENSAIARCTALHEKWQECQNRWFSKDLVNTQHRLIVAEDEWKRLSSGHTQTSSPLPLEDKSAALLKLRDSIENMRNASSLVFNDYDSSDDAEGTIQEAGSCEADFERDRERIRLNIARRGKLPTPNFDQKSSAASIYSTASNDIYSKVESLPDFTSNSFAATPLQQNFSPGDALKKVSLASGTATVLEVLEPTTSEEELFKNSLKDWTSSPTKRLLEMGISAHDIIDGVTDKEGPTDVIKKSIHESNFINKSMAEEHVLPDSFDEVSSDKNDDKMKVSPKSKVGEIVKTFNANVSINSSAVRMKKAWYEVHSDGEEYHNNKNAQELSESGHPELVNEAIDDSLASIISAKEDFSE